LDRDAAPAPWHERDARAHINITCVWPALHRLTPRPAPA
jgi:hypothetical protein